MRRKKKAAPPRNPLSPFVVKLRGWIHKYHAIPVLAIALFLLSVGEERHHRAESVFGEAFILAEIDHIVKFLGEFGSV